ncbi:MULTISPECIES: hypothetical protein [unclassified Microcystis]|jgi:hypothetical protein|uniref:hypothetical protein n=1 Tax=unclassified Microcystis TaxID=2643300 RepID=UPI002584D702|nr:MULTISPECIES: hypothetical protein [unclassified Microcystis]MCA6572845.1 hypothetical protein [Pseudanabaena sp. M53BS1SP1A06MG]MCA6581292.1 hypothetical protein [Pseudanabaena sp. M34BS1SP1A06MG]MCA6590617.1 hypothetical protein [Pseudanabaena sp. M38BS1SP1A06MG]MCA6610889.1 hypothetical protein [Pseudanabaena sp. M158S2SP1A06QC]MCA2537650.1 hypothetical protein [Microcystis sp. M57BS1]
MNISTDALYILVEGTPNSPETTFFQEFPFPDDKIRLIFVEVGGSGSFNIIAELIYNQIQDRKKSIHHKIPVLAITDNDFREYSEYQNISDSLFRNLIEKRQPQKIYLERHEWENFLLDELDIMVDILNSDRVSKVVENRIEKDYIENFLLQYFQNPIQIQTEFIQCIRFRFRDLRKNRPSLEDPKYTDIQDISNLKLWYTSELSKQSQILRDEIESQQYLDIFDSVLASYNWKSWIENPNFLLLEDAKKYFRGKEAFKSLLEHLVQKFRFSPSFLNEKEFKPLIIAEILKNRDKSTLVDQINKLLLPYLEKAKDILE